MGQTGGEGANDKLSALALSYVMALVFKYVIHVNPYLASTVGIVSAFFYNFVISKRFVFVLASTKATILLTYTGRHKKALPRRYMNRMTIGGYHICNKKRFPET